MLMMFKLQFEFERSLEWNRCLCAGPPTDKAGPTKAHTVIFNVGYIIIMITLISNLLFFPAFLV